MIDNAADDWRVAMDATRSGVMALELLICSLHPLPGEYYFTWTTRLTNHNGRWDSNKVSIQKVSIRRVHHSRHWPAFPSPHELYKRRLFSFVFFSLPLPTLLFTSIL